MSFEQMNKPILLDLFCGQGGASKGYEDAGFHVVGVDMTNQPRYPYEFMQGDAHEVLNSLLSDGYIITRQHRTYRLEHFDAIHASPPCQAYTIARHLNGNDHPDLVDPVRELLEQTGLPYVIENVPGAPLIDPVTLCGHSFGLETYRHREFETNWPAPVPVHFDHTVKTTKMGRPPVDGEYMHIVGHFSGVERAREIMEIPWATQDGLREAIPPKYTEFIGRYLKLQINQ